MTKNSVDLNALQISNMYIKQMTSKLFLHTIASCQWNSDERLTGTIYSTPVENK